jgi:CRP/FNR family transcriptional regulator, cyclic AMP receptor protein
MPLIPDSAVFQQKLGSLPLVTYQAGETVLAAGSRSGQLLILTSGVVAIVKGDIEIATVREPGAVLGELSALLDQPHTADVRALETSQFHVADASSLLGKDPIALLYIAAILARRLDSANQALIELKSQLQAGEPRRRAATYTRRRSCLTLDTLSSGTRTRLIKFGDEEYGPYHSQAEAMLFAIDAAQKLGEQGENTQVGLMGEHGRFRPEWSYGKDPYPPQR